MKTKSFNLTYQYSMIGTVTIDVPENLTLEEAIQYAKDNIEDIPLPTDSSYLTGSCLVDDENCDFNEG